MADEVVKKKRAATKKKIKTTRGKKRPTVLVTGASGGLGRLLCRALHRQFNVIGVDRRPFPDRPKDVEHHRIDLRRKSAMQLIRRKKPDSIVHLGIIHDPQSEEAYSFNLKSTSQLLNAAEKLKVRKFVFLSSANLYGPSATTSSYLQEEAPLLAAATSPEVRDLISLDMMVQSFFWKRPETETVILRPVHIVGPHLQNAPSKYFRMKRIPTIAGFDPMVQLVHEQDVVDAIMASIAPGARGVFNIIGGGQAPLSRLIQACGATPMPVPHMLLSATVQKLFQYHLTKLPSAELDHLKYSCLVDGSRAGNELKYQPKYSLRQTLSDV